MPCDYSQYPKDWKSRIRPDILERDKHKCVFCGLDNYAIGIRDEDGSFIPNEVPALLTFEEYRLLAKQSGLKLIKIVLTIAHLDHNHQNNEYSNLAALCQKCHFGHDKEQHATNARATIARKKLLSSLFHTTPEEVNTRLNNQ